VSVRSVKKLDEGARNRFSSSRLALLLQQWQVLEPLAAGRALPEQLARWLDWTDAVSLSSVLAGELPGHAGLRGPADAAEPRAAGRARTPAQVRQGLTQVRDGLVAAIATDPLFTATDTAADAADFAACRRQYQAHQRAMERQLVPWREAVRALLTGHLQKPSFRERIAEGALDALKAQDDPANVPALVAAIGGRLATAPTSPPVSACGGVVCAARDVVCGVRCCVLPRALGRHGDTAR
jgi:hypothetical protein